MRILNNVYPQYVGRKHIIKHIIIVNFDNFVLHSTNTIMPHKITSWPTEFVNYKECEPGSNKPALYMISCNHFSGICILFKYEFMHAVHFSSTIYTATIAAKESLI